MFDEEKNITTINNEDKNFIQALISLSPEKQFFVKGIIVGMETQKRLEEANRSDSQASYYISN
ncbi:MAG: hypothetical protein OSJ45_03885 [Lachnospiraceae bacterium]|nr:hypothetical protein [Lachnospiraceae bacterium]